MPQVINEEPTTFPCPQCQTLLVRHVSFVRGWMGNELKQETSYVCPADASHIHADYDPAAAGNTTAARRRMPPMTNPPSDASPMITSKPDVSGL